MISDRNRILGYLSGIVTISLLVWICMIKLSYLERVISIMNISEGKALKFTISQRILSKVGLTSIICKDSHVLSLPRTIRLWYIFQTEL